MSAEAARRTKHLLPARQRATGGPMTTDATTPDPLARLTTLVATMTPGPWRAGRSDMESYDGDGTGPYKNVYADDPNGTLHLGRPLPMTVARGETEACYANARGLAALRNLAAPLLAVLRAAQQMREAEEAWDDACREGLDGGDMTGPAMVAATARIREARSTFDEARAALNAAIAQEVGGDG